MWVMHEFINVLYLYVSFAYLSFFFLLINVHPGEKNISIKANMQVKYLNMIWSLILCAKNIAVATVS